MEDLSVEAKVERKWARSECESKFVVWMSASALLNRRLIRY